MDKKYESYLLIRKNFFGFRRAQKMSGARQPRARAENFSKWKCHVVSPTDAMSKKSKNLVFESEITERAKNL